MAVHLRSTPLPGAALLPTSQMGLEELEIVRLILRGGSVVDWKRLVFRNREEVDHFLHLSLYDLADPRDERRLRSILSQAVAYLRSAFGYRVATPVAQPPDVRDLFLLASGVQEPHRYRRIACVVLKVMHVIHHLEARELLFRAPIREADLAAKVRERVMAEARRMKELGFPIVEFQGNVKTRDSLVTKLMAKRESVAAQIFDRVRYRIVTEKKDQIVPVLHHLTQTLFPFNYLVPGQTRNNLVRFRQLLAAHPRAEELALELQMPLDVEAKDKRPQNEFSARDYKMLNFVVDLPVRIDEHLPVNGTGDDLGRVVYALVEFQVLDAATARANEQGESAHDRYKKRQLKKVLRRLSRGLVVPQKKLRKA